MNEDLLESLAITSIGHKQKILKAIGQLAYVLEYPNLPPKSPISSPYVTPSSSKASLTKRSPSSSNSKLQITLTLSDWKTSDNRPKTNLILDSEQDKVTNYVSKVEFIYETDRTNRFELNKAPFEVKTPTKLLENTKVTAHVHFHSKYSTSPLTIHHKTKYDGGMTKTVVNLKERSISLTNSSTSLNSTSSSSLNDML